MSAPYEDKAEHVHVGYQEFGLRRVRALCTCGFMTKPVATTEDALALLLKAHGAREQRPGEFAGFPYQGGVGGDVRPEPGHPA